MAHSIQVVFACEDPDRLARFWAEALGYVLQPPPEGFETWDAFADAFGIPRERRDDVSAAVDPSGIGPRLLFERWEGGAPNIRVHIDVNSVGGDGLAVTHEERRSRLQQERFRLETFGATFHREATPASSGLRCSTRKGTGSVSSDVELRRQSTLGSYQHRYPRTQRLIRTCQRICIFCDAQKGEHHDG